MRQMIPLFKNIGKVAGKTSTCVAWGAVGYDPLDAAFNKDFEKALQTATTGSAGLLVVELLLLISLAQQELHF